MALRALTKMVALLIVAGVARLVIHGAVGLLELVEVIGK